MTTYGGTLYGTSIPGRVDPLLATAQASSVRTTGLKVSVIDPQVNRWELFAGTALSSTGLISSRDKANSVSQAYRGYRLGMGMCILANGTIVRVRIGDGTYPNWTAYYQEITDPTNPSQWTTWTVFWSTNANYAIAVVPATASTYNIYTARADGIYSNNVKRQSITGVIEINPVQGQTNAMFVTKVFEDPLDHRRVMDHFYSPNIGTTGFSDDTVNYRWIRSELSALSLADGRIARAQVAGFYINPRSTDLAESLTISFAPSFSNIAPSGPPIIIRGFAGQAGSNSIANPFLTKMLDGYYYLFYTEIRYDADKTYSVSVNQTVFWQRSVDLIHWSEPVAIGYPGMNPTGISVVETGGYAYLANNGAVYRRPTAPVTYDVSNFVNKVTLETPKQNQSGTGEFLVANPNGINDAILNLTDCEVKVEVGLKCSDGAYRYIQFGRWWIDRVQAQIANKSNRLQVSLYDLWKRLDNPLRDNFNNIGCVHWLDWRDGARNKLFNYYYRGGTFKAVKEKTWYYITCTKVTANNAFLYTGAKSHNGDVQVKIRTDPAGQKVGVVYRYQNEKNYYWAYSDGGDTHLVRVKDGKTTSLATNTTNVRNWFTIKVVFRWGIHKVYINDSLRITYNEAQSGTAPGYTGVRGTQENYAFYNFRYDDWQPDITTNDLVTTLLAMGDFHSPSVAGGEAAQLAIVWGPQTDLNTPAKALLDLFGQFKLELAWRNNRVEVGQFKEKTIVANYANEVLGFQRTEEIGRRINLASVDGREDSWIEIDGPDSRFRGRQIVAYFDVPELADDNAVVLRAQEEIRKGVIGTAYELLMPFQFDLWRMDGIHVTDNNGYQYDMKVEGIALEVAQAEKPKQEMKLELSPLT